MAKVKYFHDRADGETIDLVHVYGMKNADFAARFPGVTGRRYDSFTRLVGLPEGGRGDNDALPVSRTVTYKSQPSRHKCDSRCLHAKGRTMNCECSCGGKNHGKGA